MSGREMTLVALELDDDDEEAVEIDIMWPEGFDLPRNGDAIEVGEIGDSVMLTVQRVMWRVFDATSRDVQIHVARHRSSWSGGGLTENRLRYVLGKAGMLR